MISVFLSLLQWNIKISRTLTFLSAAFNFIIVAHFLKFNYLKHVSFQNYETRSLGNTNNHCFFIYIAVKLKFTYMFFITIPNFWLYSQKYGAVATDMHFSFHYVVTKACLIHALSVYAVLTGVWCSETKHDHRS
jgi:hypothetical protein